MGGFRHHAILLAALLLFAPIGAGLALDPLEPVPDAWVRDILSTEGYVDDTQLLAPEHLPAPERSDGIGPGSRIHVRHAEGSFLCSANFIWVSGTDYYLGTAGHCLLPSDLTATHGPGADYDPAGTRVSVCIANCVFGGQSAFLISGSLASLGTATYARQTDAGGDVGNDFGLIRIPTHLYPYIRPSMPVWKGPVVGDNPSSIMGAHLCQYGHGIIVGETFATQAKTGTGLFVYGGGAYDGAYGTQGGDSGSAVQTCRPDGAGLHGDAAVGIHTHSRVAFTPWKAGTTVAKAKEMASRDLGRAISVVTGA